MSLLDLYRSRANSLRTEIATLTERKAREHKSIADLNAKIQRATQSIHSTKTLSTIQSKQREIMRYQNDIAKVEKNIADYESKIAKKNKDLQSELKKISDEEIKEAKRAKAQSESIQRQQQQSFDRIHRTLIKHEDAITQLQSLPDVITVLFLASNPRDQVQLSLDEEVRSIKEMITKAKHRDSVKLESCWAVRPGDILQAMNEFEPTIVHFSGHGSDTDELVLIDNQQRTKLVSLDAIVQAMNVANDNLRLVFFNTCFSKNQAKKVVEHIDSAIGMKNSISDEAARIFSAQFYSSLSFGYSIGKAFNQAKAALMLEGVAEEDTPELFVKEGLEPNDLYIVAE